MKYRYMRKSLSILLLFIFIEGCSTGDFRDALPFHVGERNENYHCWPYDVNVYSVENIKIDSVFFTFPRHAFYGEQTKYQMSNWSRYDVIDTTVWYGMKLTLENCDDNHELFERHRQGNDIYFAGIYRERLDKNEEKKRVYNQIMFLDVTGKKLHVFEDINN